MDSVRNRLRVRPSPIVKATVRATRRPPEYADLLRQSEADFRRYVHELESSPLFLRLMTAGWLSRVRFGGWRDDSERQLGGYAPNPTEFAPAPAATDLSDLVELFAQFVDEYGLSHQDFVDFVLDESANPAQLASRFHCTLEQANTMKEAVDRLHLIETFEADAAPRDVTLLHDPVARHDDEPIARVCVRSGRMLIEIAPDSLYATRYRMRRREGNDSLTDDERELLAKLRLINQRTSVVGRLVTELCEFQRGFLLSDDPLQLRPVSQAEIARRMKEHPSTISRALHGKHLMVHDRQTPLRLLIQTTREVVWRLGTTHPELSDRQLTELLRRDYGCTVTRRTVSHHRAARAV